MTMWWHLLRAFFLHHPVVEDEGKGHKEVNWPFYNDTHPTHKDGATMPKNVFKDLSPLLLPSLFNFNKF